MAASPHFAHRLHHMNETGQAPAIGTRIEMLPAPAAHAQTSAVLPPPQMQQKELPAPAKKELPAIPQQSLRQRVKSAITTLTQPAVSDDTHTVASEPAEKEVSEEQSEPEIAICHYCGENETDTIRRDPVDGPVPICLVCMMKMSVSHVVNKGGASASPLPLDDTTNQ